MIRLLAMAGLALAVPALGLQGEDRSDRASAERRFEESVRVERAHWPVLIRALPGAGDRGAFCSELGPADVEVLQDGEPLQVTAVGTRPLPRIHALLIDTSRSMVRDRLERGTLLDEAKRAASGYVAAVPDDDAVLIASFDESMVLRAPPGPARDLAPRVIEGLEAGFATALWDALHDLVLYAETLPGEKIVLLLTDGEDSSSLKEHSFERVLALVAGAPDLSVFPIGVDLPRSVRRGVPTARGRLGELARQTGGEFFDIGRSDDLDRVFRRVRARLDDRRYVSYVPEPAAPGEAGARLRIRLRPGLPCRLSPLGLPGRFERRAQGASADLDRGEATADDLRALLPATADLFPSAAPVIDGTLRLREVGESGSGAGPGPVLFTVRGREALLGEARDLLVERGPLFRLGPYLREGKLRTDTLRRPEFGARAIAVLTPPIEDLLDLPSGPEDLLLRMLERELPAPPRSDGPTPVRAPFVVHGLTFLELRELIGRAIFDAYPGYRAWALDRVERKVSTDLGALLARSPEAGGLGPEERERLRRAMLLRAADPAEGRPHLPLAEWIADVPARETAIELERRLADRLLRGGGERPGDPAAAERVAAEWWRLGRWFPPAVDVRILAPLIPVYDSRRDAIGFYRFLLPWPELLGPRTATLPSRPLGLRTVLLLAGPGGAELPLPACSRLLALRYDNVGRREWLDAGCPDDRTVSRDAEKVELVLGGGETDEKASSLRLSVYFPAGSAGEAGTAAPPRPACWRAEAGEGEVVPPGLEELARELDRALTRVVEAP